jgi:hypothetical protein
MMTMTAGALVAELRARQWVVRDVHGATAGQYFEPREALEALAGASG